MRRLYNESLLGAGVQGYGVITTMEVYKHSTFSVLGLELELGLGLCAALRFRVRVLGFRVLGFSMVKG